MLGSLEVQQHSQNRSQQKPPPPTKGASVPPPRRISPSNLHTTNHLSGRTSPISPSQPRVRTTHASSISNQTLHQNLHTPPPPNYGFGPRPNQAAQNRPPVIGPPQSHPLPLSVPSSDDPQQLYPLFRAANKSKSGALTESELGSALVNGDYSAFDANTVKMMVRMFDRDSDGSIVFDEFVSLWRFLASWRELFDRFDEDRSGRISLSEFEKALVAFGYRLSQPFVRMIFTAFESKGRGKASAPTSANRGGMSFDLFVQACISLKRMTDVFKRYDDDRDGYITVSFEEFLTGKFASRITFPHFFSSPWLCIAIKPGVVNHSPEIIQLQE
jgi:peflin